MTRARLIVYTSQPPRASQSFSDNKLYANIFYVVKEEKQRFSLLSSAKKAPKWKNSFSKDEIDARYKRLVFTSDGVVVGVVIRKAERYDLVKIKPTESEAEH